MLFHLVKYSVREKDETTLGECPVKSEKGNQYTHFCTNINCLICFDSYKFFMAVLDLQVRMAHLKDSMIQKFFSFHDRESLLFDQKEQQGYNNSQETYGEM